MGRSRAELGGSALEHYAIKGWVVVPGFFSAEETDQLVRFADELCELPEIAGKQMIYREPSLLDEQARVFQRVENFCSYHSGFDKLIRGGRLESTVEQLFGGRAVLFKEKINFKMSGGAGRFLGVSVGFSKALILVSLTQAARQFLFIVPAGLGVQGGGTNSGRSRAGYPQRCRDRPFPREADD